MVDNDQFLNKAKKLVEVSEFKNFPEADLFIVWFVKALGNWKALISTDKVDGLYWEVTYNGAKNEAYVDRYQKQANVAITDQLLEEVTL